MRAFRNAFTAYVCLSLPVLAGLAACHSMPDVPFIGKKDDAAAQAAATLTAPPATPEPAARTAVLATSFTLDGALLPVMRGQQLVELRGDMRRTDALQTFDNRLLRSMAGETRSSNIVRLDKKLVWTQDFAKKTYLECPLTGCRAKDANPPDKPAPDKPSKPDEPSCPLTVKKNELKVTPTGEHKLINEFNTERIQLSWVLEMQDKSGQRNTNRLQLDLWTTPETGAVKELRALELAFSKRYLASLQSTDTPLHKYLPREVMGSITALMNRAGPANKTTANWGKEFAKVKGYPISTTLSWTAEGNACADDGASSRDASAAAASSLFSGSKGSSGPLVSFTQEVKTLELRPVTDSWFQPEAAFTQKLP